jgi:uncharacterized OB-fold protein
MVTSVPIPWRLKAQRYQLVGSVCLNCHQVAFPPREACQYCPKKTEQIFSFSSDEAVSEEILPTTSLVEVHA